MSSLSRVWLHATIALALCVITLGIRTAFASRFATERRLLNQQASQARIQELSAYWNGLSYAQVQLDWLAALLEYAARPSNGLTVTQLHKLKPRLAQPFGYLENPELGKYGALKANGLRWEFSLRSYLTNEYGAVLGSVRWPDESLTKLWQALAPPSAGMERPRLTAICLTNLTLVTSRTNSRSAIVNGPTQKGLTMPRVAIEPGFAYEPKHTVTDGGGPDELYAHFSFYARSNTSTNAGPVYLSLAWSEPDQEWVLGRLMADVLLKFEFLF
jgi:hypothetical protein